MMIVRHYSDLIKLESFEERFNYLKLNGEVGKDTFGFDRYLNQMIYSSPEWKRLRDIIIVRDNACDMGLAGCDIYERLIVHHMNPIAAHDILEHSDDIFDPEYLITVSFSTHNAIHYGDLSILNRSALVERKPNDTCPWKR